MLSNTFLFCVNALWGLFLVHFFINKQSYTAYTKSIELVRFDCFGKNIAYIVYQNLNKNAEKQLVTENMQDRMRVIYFFMSYFNKKTVHFLNAMKSIIVVLFDI